MSARFWATVEDFWAWATGFSQARMKAAHERMLRAMRRPS